MSDAPTIADKPRVSEKFNSEDAEIVFQSSDGIQFRIHRVNLLVCSEGFSPPDHCTFNDVVFLPESSSTMDLLFRFIYPEPQPDIENLEFEVLAPLAEAAEKYLVYSAMNTCTINLIKRLPDHDTEILLHALRHSKAKLLARVAPLLLDRPLQDIVPLLPDHHIVPWKKTKRFSFGADADIVFRSRNSVRFNVHRRNVQVMSKNLIPLAHDGTLDTIPLLESSSVLKVLFSFMYPDPHPDLEEDQLLPLELIAAAAEKYEIYPAIAITDIRLRDAVPRELKTQPGAVMQHAVRTKNLALIDQVALLLIGNAFAATTKLFDHAMTLAWLEYHEKWHAITQNALEFVSQMRFQLRKVEIQNLSNHFQLDESEVFICDGCMRPDNYLIGSVVGKLGRGVQSLQNLDDTFSAKSYCCNQGEQEILSWRRSIEDAIRSLPKLSAIASGSMVPGA
ncbi:hypothetical protein H0H81_002333 [Sphagnurus paluster]|uniref:BTB domain-containing protein n=1 Tax=Sphagnurus paluster TaxID=117069 RepID=A0A9P7FPF6_9AGAR|nr:hypothetical protein H0H81_002333 [Sphagnurus paluster]